MEKLRNELNEIQDGLFVWGYNSVIIVERNLKALERVLNDTEECPLNKVMEINDINKRLVKFLNVILTEYEKAGGYKQDLIEVNRTISKLSI